MSVWTHSGKTKNAFVLAQVPCTRPLAGSPSHLLHTAERREEGRGLKREVEVSNLCIGHDSIYYIYDTCMFEYK